MTDRAHAASGGTYRVSPNVAGTGDGTWCLPPAGRHCRQPVVEISQPLVSSAGQDAGYVNVRRGRSRQGEAAALHAPWDLRE